MAESEWSQTPPAKGTRLDDLTAATVDHQLERLTRRAPGAHKHDGTSGPEFMEIIPALGTQPAPHDATRDAPWLAIGVARNNAWWLSEPLAVPCRRWIARLGEPFAIRR
jgi:hypothetical protein